MSGKEVSALSVYLYIPNIIGYLRILFCFLSYYYALDAPLASVACYFLGQGMDALDGYAARYFDQCSRFGTILDMLTDRMGTAVLFIVISHLYPGTWGYASFFIVLDLVSHWCQMYVSLTAGKTSHKGSKNPILNYYYTNRMFLFGMCCGNEFFIMALYLVYFFNNVYIQAILYLTFPVFAGKQFLNVLQLLHNAHELVLVDVQEANKKK